MGVCSLVVETLSLRLLSLPPVALVGTDCRASLLLLLEVDEGEASLVDGGTAAELCRLWSIEDAYSSAQQTRSDTPRQAQHAHDRCWTERIEDDDELSSAQRLTHHHHRQPPTDERRSNGQWEAITSLDAHRKVPAEHTSDEAAMDATAVGRAERKH